jgi:glutamyl-tRNA synthetase
VAGVSAVRGRFAPSPTGLMHLGSAAAALVCIASARRSGGSVVLRVEDLDVARASSADEAAIFDDLAWLGLRFDEGPREGGGVGPYRQSERGALYEAAIDALARRGLAYLCDCSRAEIARASSAPHPGEEGPRYPGTCRPEGMRSRAFRRPPAVRLAVPEGSIGRYQDVRRGTIEEDVERAAGDFVLRRGDGAYAYQLAVVVDDLAMGTGEIVRGADLAPSAARQAFLAELLGGRLPRVLHVPMLVGHDGARLAKRSKGVPIRDHRERPAGHLVRALASAYGHALDVAPDAPLDRVVETWCGAFDPDRLPDGDVPLARVEEALS